jgi:hypothetical protein
MLKFKNETKTDIPIFGLHFAKGNTVAIPERVARNPQKLAWLRSNFTEVIDQPAPVTIEASTPKVILEPATIEAPSVPRRTYRKKATARRRNYHGDEV